MLQLQQRNEKVTDNATLLPSPIPYKISSYDARCHKGSCSHKIVMCLARSLSPPHNNRVYSYMMLQYSERDHFYFDKIKI